MQNTTPKTITRCKINSNGFIHNSSRRLGKQTENNVLRNSHIPAIAPNLPLSLSFPLDMYQIIDAVSINIISAPEIQQFLRG